VFERHASGSWSPFMTIPLGDLDGTDSLQFSADGRTLYMLDSRGRGKAALVAMDMATKKASFDS
jgi:sugar lactone lactonase YvrE